MPTDPPGAAASLPLHGRALLPAPTWALDILVQPPLGPPVWQRLCGPQVTRRSVAVEGPARLRLTVYPPSPPGQCALILYAARWRIWPGGPVAELLPADVIPPHLLRVAHRVP